MAGPPSAAGNASVSPRLLHGVTAALEAGVGLPLLCLPSSSTLLLVGAPVEAPAALTVARVAGAALLALGVACWLSRHDTQSCAGRALTIAMALYNIGVSVVLAWAGSVLELRGVLLWPAVVLHVVMTVWCAVALLQRRTVDQPS